MNQLKFNNFRVEQLFNKFCIKVTQGDISMSMTRQCLESALQSTISELCAKIESLELRISQLEFEQDNYHIPNIG